LLFDARAFILLSKDLPDRMSSHHIFLGVILLAAMIAALGSRYGARKKARIPRWGFPGLAIILFAEVLLFRRVPWVPIYFTPIVWTGYLLFADALVYSLRGSSLLAGSVRGFITLAACSIPLWLIFEAYNLRLRNWTYVGLPQNIFLRWLGYGWSFATIWPAIFETADLLSALAGSPETMKKPRFSSLAKEGPGVVGPSATTPNPLLDQAGSQFPSSEAFPKLWPAQLLVPFVLGLACLVIPLLVPPRLGGYLFGAVWVGFVLLFDPINYCWGGRSLGRDLARGHAARLAAFLSSGLVCGILWEFWNYWAAAKWLYIFPIWQNWKVFEMPAPGFLGFPPFAVECAVMYEFLRLLYNKVCPA
jgi:hypothetical protein